MESLLSGVWVVVWACVCSILWHVKEIEFHKEIWSLIRLFILMQSSGLNLSVVYDSLRHVLSLPTFPSTPSPPSLAPHPASTHPNTHTLIRLFFLAKYLAFRKNTLFCWLSVQCIITPSSHASWAETNPCLSMHAPLLSPTKGFTGALKQFVIFRSTKQDITLIRDITLDQEEVLMLRSCRRCNGPRRPMPGLVSTCTDGLYWPLIRIQTSSSKHVHSAVVWFHHSVQINMFSYSVTAWKHCCDKYFVLLRSFTQFILKTLKTLSGSWIFSYLQACSATLW